MKRMAMAILTVIVFATTLYWVPVIQARDLGCDLPRPDAGQVCP